MENNGNGEGTAVALRPEEQNEIDAIRRKGAFEVARREIVSDMYKQISACEWGAGNSLVRGSDLSNGARAVLAHFCATVGAHPQLHVALLGGKPYLMAEYFYDKINNELHFVDYEAINISANDERRAHYGVPEWATHAYEVVIRKLVPFAPIEKIRSGEIRDWQGYVVEVREANWAGGKPKATSKKGYEYDPDPVGNDEPSKTARTRALRRCAVRAFPTWKEKYDEQVQRAERVLEAEFEIVVEENVARRAALPAASGPQAVSTAAGEPEAASANGAKDLPVEGEARPERQAAEAAPKAKAPSEQEALQEDDFDRTAARRAFFGSLRDAGIPEDGRKEWQEKHGLSPSTKEWGKADYDRAQEVLVGPTRDKVLAAAGDTFPALCQRVLGKAEPELLRDWKALEATLTAQATDAGEDL